VHPAHRNGTVIALLWTGILDYAIATGCSWVGGCSAQPLQGSAAKVAAACDAALAHGLAPSPYRLAPYRPWTGGGLIRGGGGGADGGGGVGSSSSSGGRSAIPPLLRAYLRLGAWVCGPPAYDPEFHSVDLFTLLELGRADARYLRRFGGLG
jgi:putative hemolysin